MTKLPVQRVVLKEENFNEEEEGPRTIHEHLTMEHGTLKTNEMVMQKRMTRGKEKYSTILYHGKMEPKRASMPTL